MMLFKSYYISFKSARQAEAEGRRSALALARLARAADEGRA